MRDRCPCCDREFVPRIPLTPRGKRVLDFIKEYAFLNEGITPTIREIAAGIGVGGLHNIHRIVLDLETGGHITRLSKKARSITVSP